MVDKTLEALDAVVTPVITDILLTRQAADTEDRRYTRAQVYTLLTGEHLLLPQVDEVATPTLAWGDGDTGIYEVADDVLAMAIAGVRTFSFFSGGLNSNITNAWQLLNEAATGTNPTLIPHVGSPSTGIGAFAAGSLSLVGQSVELLRGVGNASALLRQVIVSPGAVLGALATPALALGDGDSGLTEIADDALAVVTGGLEAVRYTGLSSQVLTTPDLQDVVPDAVTETQASATIINSSLGVVDSAGASNTSKLPLVFPVDTIIEVSYSDPQATEEGITVYPGVGDDLGFGLNTLDPDFLLETRHSRRYVATIADSTWAPMPQGATSLIALDAGGPAVLDKPALNGDPVILVNKAVIGTGLGMEATDELLLKVVTVNVLKLRSLAGGQGFLEPVCPNIAAFAGGGQGSATHIQSSYVTIITVGTIGDSVRLTDVFTQGQICEVFNDTANAADIFPSSGDDLGQGVNTAFSLAAGTAARFRGRTANSVWVQIF